MRFAAHAGLVAVGVLGCSEHPSGSVAFQVASRSSSDPAAARSEVAIAAGDSAVLSLGSDTIVVRRADLVLRELLLQPAESGECEPEEEEYCAELRKEPLLVAFPLADSAEHRFTVATTAGAYSALQLEVYNPDAQQDGPFLTSHPDFAGISVRLEGTYRGSGGRRDFVSSSDLTGIHELAFAEPISVPAGDTARVTLQLDLARVFLSADGKMLLDPSTASPGQPNADQVRDNIRTSLHAFPDEDGDGVDDDLRLRHGS